MPKYIKLSYNLGKKTPLYPDTRPVEIKTIKSIKKGNFCNTSLITFSNHSGTHVDAPAHFWSSGKNISRYSPEDLIFKKPFLFNCPKGPLEIISAADLKTLENAKEAEVLLIRTGFHKYRSRNARVYSYKNPCLSPDDAYWLRKSLPDVKAVCIDCVSVSSYAHRDLGKETHRILLADSGYEEAPVLIVEDVNLSSEIKRLDEVIVSPIFIEGVDSAPCTVLGVIYDRKD